MERYIGLDAHAASCTLAVISQAGKRLKDWRGNWRSCVSRDRR